MSLPGPFSTPEPPPAPAVREVWLWVGLAGGGAAWLIHFLAAYVIAEFGCVSGWGKGMYLGVTGLAWLLLGVSALMLTACTWTVLVARRSLRDLRQNLGPPEGGTTNPDDTRFRPQIYMARAGYISGVLFDFIILAETLPIFFYLQRC